MRIHFPHIASLLFMLAWPQLTVTSRSPDEVREKEILLSHSCLVGHGEYQLGRCRDIVVKGKDDGRLKFPRFIDLPPLAELHGHPVKLRFLVKHDTTEH